MMQAMQLLAPYLTMTNKARGHYSRRTYHEDLATGVGTRGDAICSEYEAHGVGAVHDHVDAAEAQARDPRLPQALKGMK